MARKGQRVFEPVATPLEDDLPVDYTLVGTENWFNTGFDEDAFDSNQCLVAGDLAGVKLVREFLLDEKIHGDDTETTGPYFSDDKGYSMNPLNPDCRIVTLQMGTRNKVWVIDPELIPLFKDILENQEILHLAHHWLYDFKWLLVKNQIHPLNLYCSMLAEQLRRAGLPGYKVGLADCARRYEPHFLISKAVRSMFIHLNNGKMSREMIKYAARDIPLLFPVYEEQMKELQAKKLIESSKLEFDCIPCTAEMEIGGVYLDLVKLNLLIKYWMDRQEASEKKIIELYTKRRNELGKGNFIVPELNEVFDLGSNKEKLEALRKIGIELDDVKRATLMTVNDPIAQELGVYSNITKMTSTYGENMLAKINDTTKLWHPRFAQMGSGASEGDATGRDNKETTATGRYVSDAQQFPRKAEHYAVENDPIVSAAAMEQFASIITKYQLEKAA